MKFNTIPEAIEDLKAGKHIIVVDDEDRENEGDLVMLAEKVTAESINFMATHGRGLICMPVLGSRLEELRLHPMIAENVDIGRCKFTVSVDAKKGATTGISANDRAVTIKMIIDPKAKPDDLARPGHIFPLRAEDEGVLKRRGHTEATIDLAKLAGAYPAGVLCEIMNDDGTMARVPDLMVFKDKFGLKIITIADLVEYRMKTETLVRRVAESTLPTDNGVFKVIGYKSFDNKEHVALIKGTVADNVLVRLHSECFTGDVLGSLRCDCKSQLDDAMEMINKEGNGLILYMRQEGRGIGLLNKLKAYELQDRGLDTVQANEKLGFKSDLRDYGIGAQILSDLGVSKIRLITNNPKKIIDLEKYGIKVSERIPVKCTVHGHNSDYIKAKREKMGHLL